MSSASKAKRATALPGRRWAEPLVQPARGMKESGSSTLMITQQYGDGRTDLPLGTESPTASGDSASAEAVGTDSVN